MNDEDDSLQADETEITREVRIVLSKSGLKKCTDYVVASVFVLQTLSSHSLSRALAAQLQKQLRKLESTVKSFGSGESKQEGPNKPEVQYILLDRCF